MSEVIFDNEFLARLRTLFFKLRKRRKLKSRGEQQTPAAGHTREFKDHRPYTSRDDFRSIDWRLFARLEKLFIRIFEEVQEYHVHILIDRSRSMIEPHPEKRVTSLRLGVALAYLSLLNQHRVSVLSIGADTRRELPPLKGQGHIHEMIDFLSQLEFEGNTDFERSLREFRPRRDRKGLVFVLSDLLAEETDSAPRALANAIHWPAETHVVHLLAPQERTPEIDGELELVDVETRETRRLNLSKDDVLRYQSEFDRYIEALHQQCMKRGVDYFTWMTDQPFENLFLALLSRGSMLANS